MKKGQPKIIIGVLTNVYSFINSNVVEIDNKLIFCKRDVKVLKEKIQKANKSLLELANKKAIVIINSMFTDATENVLKYLESEYDIKIDDKRVKMLIKNYEY